jgi:NADPH2:quinone reductase
MIDTYHRSGLYQLPLPATLGVEAAGVIEKLGPDTAELGLSEGQRVGYVLQAPGAYASAHVVPADRLIPLPDDVSDEIAAASLLKGLTVECLVRRVHPVRFGEPVLLHAAAGGVGLLALQWLSEIGAKVIATVGSDEKAELAKQHGAAHVIVYTREDFKARVRELYPEGVPVVYDSVGKATFEGSLDCLAVRGLLVSYGNASGKPPPLELGTLAAKGSLFATRPTLFSYIRTRKELLDAATTLLGMLQQKKLTPHISERFPLREAPAAHRALESRKTTGQLLLIP